eukprot:6214455-Pleurochrysis_carterae.AAC.3
MREALQELLEHGTEHVSTEGIQGVMSNKEVRQLQGALTSPTERSDIERRLTRRLTNQLMHISPQKEAGNISYRAPNGPLEINPASLDPTPLKVVEEEGLFNARADAINVFLSVEPPRQRLCAQSLSGSMKARIKLRLDSTRSKDLLSVRAVVDSDAAHTAITRSVFRRLGGTHLQPTRLTFTGVEGGSLKCLGRSPIQFALGEIWLQTSAYVFEELVEPMLLGANTVVEHGLNVDAANMALRRSKSLPVLPPDAIPLESKHRNHVFADSGRALVIHDTGRQRLCCVDSERPDTVLATVSYESTRRRARAPTRMSVGCSSQSLSARAGTVGTDTDRIGLEASGDACCASCADQSEEDHDAEQHAKHLQKVRALHEKWDEKYDDLPLADRRRLHEQAQQRRGLFHGQLSDS